MFDVRFPHPRCGWPRRWGEGHSSHRAPFTRINREPPPPPKPGIDYAQLSETAHAATRPRRPAALAPGLPIDPHDLLTGGRLAENDAQTDLVNVSRAYCRFGAIGFQMLHRHTHNNGRRIGWCIFDHRTSASSPARSRRRRKELVTRRARRRPGSQRHTNPPAPATVGIRDPPPSSPLARRTTPHHHAQAADGSLVPNKPSADAPRGGSRRTCSAMTSLRLLTNHDLDSSEAPFLTAAHRPTTCGG